MQMKLKLKLLNGSRSSLKRTGVVVKQLLVFQEEKIQRLLLLCVLRL